MQNSPDNIYIYTNLGSYIDITCMSPSLRCIGTYFQDLDTLTEGLLKFSCGGRYFRHLILNELPLYMRLSAIT